MTVPRYAPYGEAAASEIYHLLFCDSDAAESRVRDLKDDWLRTHDRPSAGKDLLGVVIEVALDDGLDTLAAYADGSVRYINHTGRMSIVEGPVPALTPAMESLFAASREVVARIGPWDRDRLPPPKRGNVRLTFLVADGLYFGEGPRPVFERDGMAGPVLAAATRLLVAVVDLSKQ